MDRLGKDVGALEDRCTVRVYDVENDIQCLNP